MKEAFTTIKFQARTLAVIEPANAIIAEYEAQGFTMSLRQLYYQFVSRDLLPNQLKSYKRLGGIMSNTRDAGLVDWDSIEDRTRELVTHSSWDSPEGIIGAVANQYREDIWANQIWRPEVWVEKHLADHDPNGLDMTRDNTERLALYAREEVEVRRIALNIDQVRRYNPPPNFAKETDSRYTAYVEQFTEIFAINLSLSGPSDPMPWRVSPARRLSTWP
jgi:hypothetical protein